MRAVTEGAVAALFVCGVFLLGWFMGMKARGWLGAGGEVGRG